MARFGEKAVYGPCMLVGASTQCFSGSLWREGSLRALCVGSINAAFWWLPLEVRQFTGRVCW